MNLDELITACKKQKLSAQSQLYKMYKNDLYVLCLKYCKNKEEAQDNLQDTFLEIFNKIKSYKGKGSFEGWMKRITINKAIDKYKSKRELNFSINDDVLADNTIENQTMEAISLQEILEHIHSLPPKYKLVFNMYELDDYSHKDISKFLGISINTSKSNLHRAKKILKTRIQQSVSVSSKNKTTYGT